MKNLRRPLKIFFFIFLSLSLSPLIILSLLEQHLTTREGFFLFGAHLTALIPSTLGKIARSAYYFFTIEKFNPNSGLGFGSFIYKRGTRVLSNLQTASYCTIGLAEIHANTHMGNHSSLISGVHEHGSTNQMELRDNACDKTHKIVIGKNSWIGEGARVGADIGDNSIVGVGAVVISPIPNGAMAMGNPARVIKGGWGKHKLKKQENATLPFVLNQ